MSRLAVTSAPLPCHRRPMRGRWFPTPFRTWRLPGILQAMSTPWRRLKAWLSGSGPSPSAQRASQPRVPGPRRLCLRRGVLGRLQHRAGTDQHREVLHRLPRDARQRLSGTAADRPFLQPSGVRATCPDCHVPHQWTDKIARKMQASKEVWGKIFGTISTRRKFLDIGSSSPSTNGRG